MNMLTWMHKYKTKTLKWNQKKNREYEDINSLYFDSVFIDVKYWENKF